MSAAAAAVAQRWAEARPSWLRAARENKVYQISAPAAVTRALAAGVAEGGVFTAEQLRRLDGKRVEVRLLGAHMEYLLSCLPLGYDADIAARDCLQTLLKFRSPAMLADCPLLWVCAVSAKAFHVAHAAGDLPGYHQYTQQWAHEYSDSNREAVAAEALCMTPTHRTERGPRGFGATPALSVRAPQTPPGAAARGEAPQQPTPPPPQPPPALGGEPAGGASGGGGSGAEATLHDVLAAVDGLSRRLAAIDLRGCDAAETPGGMRELLRWRLGLMRGLCEVLVGADDSLALD
eukprot:gene2280-4624_t